MEVFTPNELIRAIWAHPLRPQRSGPARTGLWHITIGLLRDGGILNSPEAPRSWRWPALFLAGLYQLLWCFALIWLMYFRFLPIPWAAPGDGVNADDAIEVTFIDDTHRPDTITLPTPLNEPSPAPLPPPLPEAPPQPLLPEPQPPVSTPAPEPPLTPPAPKPEQEAVPEPEPVPTLEPAPAPPSPLMVTEVEAPDEEAFTLHVPEFQRLEPPPLSPTLPPATQRELNIAEVPLLQHPDHLPKPRAPQLSPRTADVSAPELAFPERDIPAPLSKPELRSVPDIPVTSVELPTRTREISEREIPPPLSKPELQHAPNIPVTSVEIPAHVREISEREIPAPLPDIALRPSPPSELPSITLSPYAREIAEREIPLPTPPEPSQANPPLEIDLTPPTQASTPRPSVSDDAWKRPAQKADTKSGLLDEYGRPRLAGSGSRAGGGLPPGTIVEDYANIDRMGTWLKRPPPDYQSGQLDQLWVPHEDILQEWVRRSITNIWIPIPGTGKAIRCTVVLLMLGGGCGIADPNLMDTEAAARPPPDIPFKPELHEDQGSLVAPQTDPPPDTPIP